MKSFAPTTLPGVGHVSAVFWNDDRSIVAIACHYDLLTRPNVRAAYTGQRLRHAVTLYNAGSTEPIAAFRDLRLPVNDIAFHPSLPVIAIGAGRYDGGYMFEGDLCLFNWETGEAHSSYRAVPEVVRCWFEEGGKTLRLITRPWDEEQCGLWTDPNFDEATRPDPFDSFISTQVEQIDQILMGSVPLSDAINIPYEETNFVNQKTLGLAPITWEIDHDKVAKEVEEAFNRPYVKRSAIWDVKWLGATTLAVTHNDCLMEVYDEDGSLIERYTPEDKSELGVQILASKERTYLHSNKYRRDHAQRAAGNYEGSKLYRYDPLGQGLKLEHSFADDLTFSIATNGSLLGRCDRVSFSMDVEPGLDILVEPLEGKITELDLGHYDCFNHFARFDGADRHYFVQGSPRTSHEHKNLCSLDKELHETVHWPILVDDGSHASHAMELATCYGQDSIGPAIVIAGKHYMPSPSDGGHQGFIYRRVPEWADDVWRHPTESSASMLAFHPSRPLVACAFLNGELWFIQSETGEILSKIDRFEPEGLETAIYALDMIDQKIALGCLDGRIIVCPSSELLS